MSDSLRRPLPEVPGVEHVWVTAGGLRMHVAIAGPEDGRPVVLLHGWPQHWGLWKDVIPALADVGFRVHAPDLRGFGWSAATECWADYDKRRMARDVVNLLDELGLERVLLAGHDWGGWIGFLVALQEPARVERFLALNIPPPWLDPGPFRLGESLKALSKLWYQVTMATPGISRIAQAGAARGIFERALKQSTTKPGVFSDELLASYLDQFQSRRRADASMYVYRRFLLAELPQIQFGRYTSARLKVPTKLLFGLDDVAIDPAILDADHSLRADDLTIERVPDCGHFIVDEQPERVVERMLDFFAA